MLIPFAVILYLWIGLVMFEVRMGKDRWLKVMYLRNSLPVKFILIILWMILWPIETVPPAILYFATKRK